MIPIKIMTQPDNSSCGPTSLHAIYNYFGDDISLETVISEVPSLTTGGTLAVMLACHALERGYRARIYTYNLTIFDPTWFVDKHVNLSEKLTEQLKHKSNKKIHDATAYYKKFLELKGEMRYEDLSPALLRKYFNQGLPVLTGLSATYLYNTARERVGPNNEIVYDDIGGEVSGHFVVLCGYDSSRRYVIIADPYSANTISGDNYYSVKVGRLINSIMLGILTYDANLLIIQPDKF